MKPPTSVHHLAALVIHEQREKTLAHVASAVEGSDPEGVHDMRVATRRLRACLNLFAPWLDAAELARVAPSVRRLTRALGRVREIDVTRLRLRDLAAHASPERRLAIECVDARLARRWRRSRERMMARFAKVGLDRVGNRLRRLAAHLARRKHHPIANGALQDQSFSSPPPLPGDAGAIAHDEPVAALLEAVAGLLVAEAQQICHPLLPGRIGTAESAEAVHAVRIAAKKLRYALEIIAPYLGAPGDDAVHRLRALQDKLGDFHDDTVVDETLRVEIERAVERQRPLLARELRRLRSARRRVLAREERAVRSAIVRLRDGGFVELVADALRGTGVVVEVPAIASEEAPAAEIHATAASATASGTQISS